jgi:hypothetical protein
MKRKLIFFRLVHRIPYLFSMTKRFFSIPFIALGFALAFLSCNTCGNADIPVSKYDFEFTVVSVETGEDLIFGEGATLDPEGFQLYSMRGSDRILHELYAYPEEIYPGHQAIWADVPGLHGSLYLEHPDGKLDTLQAFFSQQETECWSRIDNLQEIVRNGSERFIDMYTVLRFSR